VLSFVAHNDVAAEQGRSVCAKLKEVLPRQQFPIAVQAKVGNTIIARDTVKPYRKDVLKTGGSKSVGGGDISRKKKVLEKQKAGKKRMMGRSGGGKVALSQAAFTAVISR